MVLAMCCHITFPAHNGRPAIDLYRATSVKIESSWKNLTDMATITLPRRVREFGKIGDNRVKEIFRRGDPVTVSLGVNGTLTQEFSGYIISASADIPVVIKCQDEMWKLKKLPVNIAMNDCYLPDLIKQIAPGYTYEVAEYRIGSIRFPKTTVAQVLQKLKDDYGLYSYFQQGKLVVGKIYSDSSSEVSINLERIVSNSLEYKTKDEKRIKLTATSTLVGGDKLEVSIGEEDGEKRQLTYFNITNTADLKALAQKDYDKYMADGFEGSLETFGITTISHGDKVNITSDIYPDRNGKYYCDGVVTTWERARYHRTCEIGQKVTT